MISIYCGKTCDNLPRFPLFTCTNMDTTKNPSWCMPTEGCVGSCRKKKHTVLPLNIPQYVIMNVDISPCVWPFRSSLSLSLALSFSLSLGIPSHAHSTAHARICVKPARGSERAMQLTSEYPRTRERKTAREGDSTDESSTHFLSCARGGALPRDSGEHREQSRAPAPKERYVNLRTD